MSDKGSTLITYTASGAVVFSGMTLNDWGVIIGTTIALLAALHNAWHKRELRKIAREQASIPALPARLDALDAIDEGDRPDPCEVCPVMDRRCL